MVFFVSNFNVKFDFADYYFTVPVFVFTEVATVQLAEVAHAPPLISGKDILILVSVFRILVLASTYPLSREATEYLC